MYVIDLRFLLKVKWLDIVLYEEMMEMSVLGVGVFEIRSVELVKNYNIFLYLGKILLNVKGIWIMLNEEILEKKVVIGVVLDKYMMYVIISYFLFDN